VTTPLTGQMKPLDDRPEPVEPPPLLLLLACAARICAASAALAASRSSRSSWASSRPSWTFALLLRACCGERGLLGLELLLRGDLLGGLGRERVRLLGDLRLRHPRLLASHLHRLAQSLQLPRDGAVLAADRVEVLQLVEEVAEALHLEEDAEGVGLVALVELDEAFLELLLRQPILLLQALQVLRLLLEAGLEAGELRPHLRQVGLELRDEGRERADVARERLDPLARGLDLRGEDALLGLRRSDVLAEPRDLLIDLGLPVEDALAERRGHAQGEDRADERD
jgi:hypothetical protein